MKKVRSFGTGIVAMFDGRLARASCPGKLLYEALQLAVKYGEKAAIFYGFYGDRAALFMAFLC